MIASSDSNSYAGAIISVRGFDEFSQRVAAEAPCWRDNHSEGASLYILDPDGHKMELNAGSLASRLAHYRAIKSADMVVFEAS